MLNNKEAYDILEDVRVASDIAIHLVTDLLTQDKLEEGTMQLDKAPTQIWTLVKDTLRPFIRQVCNIYKTKNNQNIMNSCGNDFEGETHRRKHFSGGYGIT